MKPFGLPGINKSVIVDLLIPIREICQISHQTKHAKLSDCQGGRCRPATTTSNFKGQSGCLSSLTNHLLRNRAQCQRRDFHYAGAIHTDCHCPVAIGAVFPGPENFAADLDLWHRPASSIPKISGTMSLDRVNVICYRELEFSPQECKSDGMAEYPERKR